MNIDGIVKLSMDYADITMEEYSKGNLNGGEVKIYELDLKTGEVNVFDGKVTTATNNKGEHRYYARKEGCNYSSFAVDDPKDKIGPYKSFNRIIAPDLEGLCKKFYDLILKVSINVNNLLNNESV